jgi:hypothetical protein
MSKHQVLINFYPQFYIEIEWLKHFTTLELHVEACRLAQNAIRYPNEHLGKCSKIGRTFKSQRWKNANSIGHIKSYRILSFSLIAMIR